MLSYSVEEGQRKSEVSYSNTPGALLVVLMKNSPKEFREFGKISGRYIHRFTKRTADSGLSFDSMMTMVFVQLDELQILLSLVADINDKKVLESAKDISFMKDIIAEVKELSENKELNPPILQDWILLSA